MSRAPAPAPAAPEGGVTITRVFAGTRTAQELAQAIVDAHLPPEEEPFDAP